jgi:hypothetical protein
MLPHKHVIISAAIGTASWWATGEPTTCVVALTAGVLPDIDHVVDYWLYHRRGEHKLILPLHGYEFVFLGGVVAWSSRNELLWVATISYLVHMLADQLENRTHQLGYSFLYRAWHRFRIDEISAVPEDAAQGRMEDIRLLKSLFHRP